MGCGRGARRRIQQCRVERCAWRGKGRGKGVVRSVLGLSGEDERHTEPRALASLDGPRWASKQYIHSNATLLLLNAGWLVLKQKEAAGLKDDNIESADQTRSSPETAGTHRAAKATLQRTATNSLGVDVVYRTPRRGHEGEVQEQHRRSTVRHLFVPRDHKTSRQFAAWVPVRLPYHTTQQRQRQRREQPERRVGETQPQMALCDPPPQKITSIYTSGT